MTTTNDLKKGTLVRLTDGRTATLDDNKFGLIRRIKIARIVNRDIFHDTGDEYMFKIAQWFDPGDGEWKSVELTPNQLALKARIEKDAHKMGWNL